MKRLAVALSFLAVLVGLGIAAACLLLDDPDVRAFLSRSFFKTRGDTPNPLGDWLDDKEVEPLDALSRLPARTSWGSLERAKVDPSTNPDAGTTELMYFHTKEELRLAEALRDARLPNKVLKIGLAPPRGNGQRGTAHWLCYVEIHCGKPISRAAIEETADRAIHTIFATVPQVDEVNLVAVERRTGRGHRPPSRFSVEVSRGRWEGVPGARSHMDNLRVSAAIWCDPRAMVDLPWPRRPGEGTWRSRRSSGRAHPAPR